MIEHALPLKELSAEGAREKAIRHGHISTLHVWWARRPLTVCRAAVFASLVSADDMDEIGFEKFVASLCKWEVNDSDPVGRHLLEQARAMIRKHYPDAPPKVLDSFAGGGSIPLEALRLGCEAHAMEYNPVAYLILKATIEYPQKYGRRLAEDVRRWGEWVLERAKEELEGFYPPYEGGHSKETVVAYIWSRTIRCPNPACGAEIPLFRQFWLARKSNKKVALYPVVNREEKRVNFCVLSGEELAEAMREGFNPSQGTVSRANARCLVCGTAARANYVRGEAREGRMGHRLIALVTTAGRGRGRNYRIARDEDVEAFERAKERLEHLKRQPSPWANGLPWVPEEVVEQVRERPLPVWMDDLYFYNMPRWCDLFNPRQLLALVTFGKWVREAIKRIAEQTDPEYAKAVGTYLGFVIDRLADYNAVLCLWHVTGEKIAHVFTQHDLKMAWDYVEINPFSGVTGDWLGAVDWVYKVTKHVSQIARSLIALSHIGSATTVNYKESFFDAVIIDPPYYDNVPYADLSDFFYVWLKRTVSDLYPEAFQWELTPKDEEIVVNPARFGGGREGEEIARRHYERLMGEALREIHRVLKPDGIAIIMFTHRSTTAWESLIRSLLSAGLYPTASWAVHTEMEASTHQRGKGAVRSTILMACRRRPERAEMGWYHRIRDELYGTVSERLEHFWDMGLRGADFFISAIGPAVGVFGRYEKVLRPDGHEVDVGELLDEVRTIAADFALQRLGRDLGLVDPPTRFYVLWRWAYGGRELEFDEANKLSKSLGAEIDELAEKHRLVKRRGEKVTLPDFWTRLRDDTMSRPIHRALEEGRIHDLPLVDALHVSLLYWRRGARDELTHFLALCGFQDEDHRFWRVAQALYEAERDEPSLETESVALGGMLPAQSSLVREAAGISTAERQLRLPF
ncbi:DUF1156 domain-containing protein [Candidatus Poribacteria bacterium]|nr:DUF1156 domain-containing protein [Candidatus Poribacteria bacterium]